MGHPFAIKILVFVVCCSASSVWSAPFVDVKFSMTLGGAQVIDVFYTPEQGTEFTAWDLIVTPTIGGILDPNPGQRSFNTSTGNVPLDTFANTVFSAVGAGSASHIFTDYHPGSPFPLIAQDPLPKVGGDPSRLFWTVFDTSTGDSAIDGFTPYHMARVMGNRFGAAFVEVRYYNNRDGDVPFVLNITPSLDYDYGLIIPEPGSVALAGMGLIGLACRRRNG